MSRCCTINLGATSNDVLSAEAAPPAGKGDEVESEYSSAEIRECASQNTKRD